MEDRQRMMGIYEITPSEISQTINTAIYARKFSYSPYSKYAVGSAILANSGEIYTGCNIENASYPVGICAERTALSKAISFGEYNFRALALVGGTESLFATEFEDYCMPCGMCRQFLSEFCDHDFIIITAKSEYDYKVMKLSSLFPMNFKLK